MSLLPSVIIESKIKQTATLIFLHGLGDDGHGWAESFQSIVPPFCKIVCPNAKAMPVTLNCGMTMPSWFDIYSLTASSKQDEPGIISASKERPVDELGILGSCKQLGKWVSSEEKSGIPANRIIVGGFSQGGSVALHYAITNSEVAIGGVLALSCWLPMHESFVKNPSLVKADKSLSIFQCHGKADGIVPLTLGLLTNSVISQMGFTNCTMKEYPGMDHSSCNEEIKAIKEFLQTRLPS